MRKKQPSKDDIISALQQIQARDGSVSLSVYKAETGWDRYWFDKHWPVDGYQGACTAAGVKRGEIIGVETNVRLTDDELAIRYATVVKSLGKIPPIKRFTAIAKMAQETFTRGDTYEDAKRRVIAAYFELPSDKRDAEVDDILPDELHRLDGKNNTLPPNADSQARLMRDRAIDVPREYLSLVREFRDRGEEEKRQLVAQFFYSVLAYKRTRVLSEHKHNDVRVHDRRNKPWLVVEVKQALRAERDRRAARRQEFDYAHRLGMRFVVISDGDFYEVFDRYCGERLSYDEMRQGTFQLSSLRMRDSDLLGLLASER